MPEKELKDNDKAGAKSDTGITFVCQCCDKIRPLKDMRSVTRFVPVLIVCRDCEKFLR